MSKAFVSEDAVTEEELPEEPDPEGPRLITPEGHARLRDEQTRLRERERPALAEAIRAAEARAAAVEAQDLTRQLRRVDRRLRYLTRRLAVLEVIAPQPNLTDRVAFGAWVTVEDGEGEQTLYRVVGPDESDASRGWLSAGSPLGRALLGREPGEEVAVPRPRGPSVVTIQDIRYDLDQPSPRT